MASSDLLNLHIQKTIRDYQRPIELTESNRKPFLEAIHAANPGFGDAVVRALANKKYLSANISFAKPLKLDLGWVVGKNIERPPLTFSASKLTVYGNGHFQRQLGDISLLLSQAAFDADQPGQIDQTHETYIPSCDELLSTRGGEWRFTPADPYENPTIDSREGSNDFALQFGKHIVRACNETGDWAIAKYPK